MSQDETPILQFDHVAKHFRSKERSIVALDDADISVREGEFLSIVGPSGCGKSTLLNMAAGLMPPTRGTVFYRGKQVLGVNTNVGYVTQRDNLIPWRRVHENVRVALEIRGTTNGADREALVGEVIERVGLAGFAHHYPAELSGGMRKRVTLARTLIYNPETLLMDEPFGALDAQLKLVLQNELLDLWSEDESKTIVFVTHDLNEAVALSDRVVVLSARPSRVKVIREVDLPRPRDVFAIRFDRRFTELSHELWEILQADIMKGESM